MPNVLETDRNDAQRTRTVDQPTTPLADGQVRFAIESFALTANNITYAVAGDMLGYWDFFPTGDDAWGRVPAMGWATISESTHPEVPVGSRYYGWFPLASEHVATVAPTSAGIRDDGPHRSQHAPVYRGYVATDRDPYHQDGTDAEHRHALLRGLFVTGFLADGHLALTSGSATQTVVLSASSKTAIGYAACATARGVEVVGVTSPRNVDFVRSLPYYDQVVTYDEVDQIAVASSTVVDMAGVATATAAVHDRLGDSIARSLTIGMSHHEAERVPVTAGPAPEFFFAPTASQALIDEKGAERHEREIAEALFAFVDASSDWLTVDVRSGADAVAQAWSDVYDGTVPPNVGVIGSQT